MNYRDGKMIVIGKSVTSQYGVMFPESLITYAEAKRYDPKLTEKEFNKLLGIEEPKKSEKKILKDKSEKKILNNKSDDFDKQ